MKRIGITASRIAKDDLLMYNLMVIVLSFLFSLLIFLMSAFTLLAGVALVSYVTRGFMAMDAGTGFYKFAISGLAGVVGVINLVAVLINLKLKR